MSTIDTNGVSRPRSPTDLLKYPNEIIVQILAELDYRDLLALRQTSHALHNLVHTHESALTLKYLESLPYRKLLGHSLLFAPNDLSQLIDLSIRSNVATKLAMMMGERIASKLNFRHTPFGADELKVWKARKAKRLVSIFEPAMFVLYEFFAQLRESIFDVAEKLNFLSDEDYLALGRVFELDQQYMIEQVSADLLVDTTEAWRALTGVCSAKGLAGHGRLATTIRSCLAYGDFCTFADAICKADCTSGDGKMNALIFAIWDRDVTNDVEARSFEQPLKTINHLRYRQNKTKTKLTSLRRRETQMKLIEAQPFWEKPALSVMQRRGLVGKIDPHIPTIETWMRAVISEKGDPWFEFGRWNRPDEP